MSFSMSSNDIVIPLLIYSVLYCHLVLDVVYWILDDGGCVDAWDANQDDNIRYWINYDNNDR